MHKHTALQRLRLLGPSVPRTPPKHQLRPELPVERDVVVFLHLLVDDGVVVLQVCAEAFGLEGNPQRVLVHGGGVLAPVAEVVRVDGEGFAQGFDGLGVFEEEDLWWGGLVSGMWCAWLQWNGKNCGGR